MGDLLHFTKGNTVEDIYSQYPHDSTATISEMSRSSDRHHVDNKSSQTETVSVESLYPLSEEYNPNISTALSLTNEAVHNLTKAIEAYRQGESVLSDDFLMRAQAVMPELYCCRKLGEGFSLLIQSVFHSIANEKGLPLDEDKLTVLRKVMMRIKTEPFISFDESMGMVDTLEKCGLSVEPSYYKAIAEVIGE